jgi:hypothetical protein
MGTEFPVVAVGRNGSNHIGGIDVFEGGVHTFLLAISNDLCLQKDPNVLNKL